MRDILAEGRFLRLVSVDGWEWAERRRVSGVVAVVAVTPDGRLLLTEQHRRPLGGLVIDLPAGLAGDEPGAEDEALENAARRELEEEAGWTADHLAVLATCPTSPGLTNETVTILHASGLRRIGAGGGVAGEGITVHAPLISEVRTWLATRAAAGVLIDPKVYAGLWLVAAQAPSL